MVDPTIDYCYVTTDEVGKRIAGYTVRGGQWGYPVPNHGGGRADRSQSQCFRMGQPG
jgi:hypothetical protein